METQWNCCLNNREVHFWVWQEKFHSGNFAAEIKNFTNMRTLLTFIAAIICVLRGLAQTVAPDTTSRNEVAEGLLTVLLPAIAEKDSTKNQYCPKRFGQK